MSDFVLSPRDKSFSAVKATPRRQTRFVIGDEKDENAYQTQFKSESFENECNFSVRLALGDPANNMAVETEKGVEVHGPEFVARFYETPAGDVAEEGGFEFEIEFAAKPASNIIPFTIRTKGLRFEYQPPLSDFEKQRGCTRPDDIVGSYAVFHETKGRFVNITGPNYANGKIFHIRRPWAQDAKGVRVWCDLSIDAAAETMAIRVPQDFLDAATYPIVVDPTYGYTSLGASEDPTDNSAVAYDMGVFGGTNNSTTVSAVWYGRRSSGSGSSNVEVAGYSDSGGTTRPASLVTAKLTASLALTTSKTQYTISQSDSFAWQTTTKYWAAAASALGSGWCNEYDIIGAIDDSFQSGVTTLQNPWVQDGSSTPARLYSFYFNIQDPGGASFGRLVGGVLAGGVLVGGLLTGI